MSKRYRLAAWLLTAALILCACAGPEPETAPSAGNIRLYGETHGQQDLLDRELELWRTHYGEGERHLFVELAYYEAQLLNRWMAAEDDALLDHLFQALEGTAAGVPCVQEFYRQIKARCPETVFHGFDVGHQYETLGAEYQDALEAEGAQKSVDYRLTVQNIRQGKDYYAGRGDAYREERMYENFVRAFDALDGESVMAICGTAHIAGGDTLTEKLRARYGGQVSAENLTLLQGPLETGELEVNGKTYPADYYGEYDLSALLPAYKSRAFWRLEGACEDLSSWTATGNVLPYSNYPMTPQEGEVYAIHYILADGSERWEYHLCSGRLWNGQPATEEVTP